MLLLIICINHLNIVDALVDFTINHKKSHSELKKDYTSDEETEKEKDSKGKEKAEEEKFFSKNLHSVAFYFHTVQKDSFISYSAPLNVHPIQEGDIQPPWAA